MNERKVIDALAEILLNHETGPLSNLGVGVDLGEEGEVHVYTEASHPFAETIDTPQLAREFVAKLGELLLDGLTTELMGRFYSEHAITVHEFADLATSVVRERLALGGVKPVKRYESLGDIADGLSEMRADGMTLASVLYAADRVWAEDEQ